MHKSDIQGITAQRSAQFFKRDMPHCIFQRKSFPVLWILLKSESFDMIGILSLLTDHLVFSPKYRAKILIGDVAMVAEGIICETCILRKEFPHLRDWCGEHLWAPSCFHGSVGNGWDAVERYINSQDTHHAKNAMHRPRS